MLHFIFCLVLVQPMKTGNRPERTENIVDWDVKNQIKQFGASSGVTLYLLLSTGSTHEDRKSSRKD